MHSGFYDRRVHRVRDLPCGGLRICVELELRRVACRSCGAVKREHLDFLADNSRYSKRFAFYVGRRCRSSAIKDIAEELHLEWHTVKELEQQYMREQLQRAGTPGPKVIGIDEVSIRKGHTYRIVVSDLLRRRPIWFGGTDRSEASMDEFFTGLGAKKNAWIRLAVMDMTYTLLAHRENLTLEGKKSLTLLLTANKRLHTAYLLKESFGQLWNYHREAWARRFFENWRASLKWQRRKPFERFAAMIERHWEGIAAYCQPENKVALGFVEGLNNKIRVLQRRAYGLRDEEYLRLKILTTMLPPL